MNRGYGIAALSSSLDSIVNTLIKLRQAEQIKIENISKEQTVDNIILNYTQKYKELSKALPSSVAKQRAVEWALKQSAEIPGVAAKDILSAINTANVSIAVNSQIDDILVDMKTHGVYMATEDIMKLQNGDVSVVNKYVGLLDNVKKAKNEITLQETAGKLSKQAIDGYAANVKNTLTFTGNNILSDISSGELENSKVAVELFNKSYRKTRDILLKQAEGLAAKSPFLANNLYKQIEELDNTYNTYNKQILQAFKDKMSLEKLYQEQKINDLKTASETVNQIRRIQNLYKDKLELSTKFLSSLGTMLSNVADPDLRKRIESNIIQSLNTIADLTFEIKSVDDILVKYVGLTNKLDLFKQATTEDEKSSLLLSIGHDYINLYNKLKSGEIADDNKLLFKGLNLLKTLKEHKELFDNNKKLLLKISPEVYDNVLQALRQFELSMLAFDELFNENVDAKNKQNDTVNNDNQKQQEEEQQKDIGVQSVNTIF